MPTEPRFLIIDLHRKQAVPATTDEMQDLVWREELTGEAYFEWKRTGGLNGEASNEILVATADI